MSIIYVLRLPGSLRERAQIEQLVRYIVEEAPEGAEKTRTFKYVWGYQARFSN